MSGGNGKLGEARAKVEIGLWVPNGKIRVKGFALGVVTRTAGRMGAHSL